MLKPALVSEAFWDGYSGPGVPSWSRRIYLYLTLGFLSVEELPSIATRLLEDSDDPDLCELATLEYPTLIDHQHLLQKHFELRFGEEITAAVALRELSEAALHLFNSGKLSPYSCANQIGRLWYEYVQEKRNENFYESEFVVRAVRDVKGDIEIFHGEYYAETGNYAEDKDFESNQELRSVLARKLSKLYVEWCEG